MEEIFGSWVGIVVILLAVLLVILIYFVIRLMITVGRLNRRYQLMMRGQDGGSIEKALISRLKKVDSLNARNEDTEKNVKRMRGKMDRSLANYGIVKYDAFDDVGGKMSFALAMLDSENTGFILDTIHSKDNCFVYLKEIVKGESYIMLSNEEIEALKLAVTKTEEQELEEILDEK